MWSVSIVGVGAVRPVIRAVLLVGTTSLASSRPLVQSLVSAFCQRNLKHDHGLGNGLHKYHDIEGSSIHGRE
jgi:hypothetical protein